MCLRRWPSNDVKSVKTNKSLYFTFLSSIPNPGSNPYYSHKVYNIIGQAVSFFSRLNKKNLVRMESLDWLPVELKFRGLNMIVLVAGLCLNCKEYLALLSPVSGKCSTNFYQVNTGYAKK